MMSDEFLEIKKKLDFVLWGLNDEDTETVLGILEMKYQENERLTEGLRIISVLEHGDVEQYSGLISERYLDGGRWDWDKEGE
jgi:hypothetical protein